MQNSPVVKTADGELALKYSWRAFHRTPRTLVWTEMFHTSCWTSPNNPPSTDLTSAALKLQGPAGLLIAWRACGAGPSTSAARIRMRRQQRSKHRTAMQKWEQKLLKKKRLKKKKKKRLWLYFFLKAWVKLRTVAITKRFDGNYFCTSECAAGTPGMSWTEGMTLKHTFSKEHVPWEKRVAEPCMSPSGTPAFPLQALLITFIQVAER